MCTNTIFVIKKCLLRKIRYFIEALAFFLAT
jgi:hypothetical protein